MIASLASFMGWWMLGCSIVSFVVMGVDKRAAYGGRRRTSEKSLLLLALIGGWPGTLAGMQWYRHKRSKPSFKYRCLLAIIFNIWLGWLVFHFQSYLPHFLAG
ncbi:MAG: DUF1294 domain-containing protein [Pseudomonadota bacterium]